MAHHGEKGLPQRPLTNTEDAVPEGDPSETTSLLLERLQAWKHMTGYLEDYIGAVAKDQKTSANEQEKILKTVSNPLREGRHFDQNIGGVASLFENIRANTQAIANLHLETQKNLTGTVLPILERLHVEVKNKTKELTTGAAKGSKTVDKARNESQKYIELLGQYTSAFDAAGGRVSALNDPYVLQRGVHHRLNRQIIEENTNRQDLLSVQNSFQTFEAHVLQTVQAALNSFQQFMGGQAERHRAMYGDMASTATNIPDHFEWTRFVQRNSQVLIDPDAPPRSMANIRFPNQGHRATKPLIEGSLERKSRGGLGVIKGYSSGYYAVTPAGYLHEFKDNDDLRRDPTPDMSLYLPDCTIGAVDGPNFAIKGKDVSGGKVGQKLATAHEFNFKAHNPADAAQWHRIIASLATGGSVPTSPVESRTASGQHQQPAAIDTKQHDDVKEARVGTESAAPHSATSATGPGTHFYGAPAANNLEERKYTP